LAVVVVLVLYLGVPPMHLQAGEPSQITLNLPPVGAQAHLRRTPLQA
jgi:hypothetical protein